MYEGNSSEHKQNSDKESYQSSNINSSAMDYRIRKGQLFYDKEHKVADA